SPMSGLTSQPNLNTLVAVLKNTPWDTGLDEEWLQRLANYWEGVRDLYSPFESGLKSGTAEVYQHEIPGGQYSNYKPQVAGLGLLDKWEECKDMYRKVNLLFGDIVKVTPSSKTVGDMAMFLVKNGLEPEDVLKPGQDLAFPESVVGMFRGMLGQPHGGWPQPLQDIVLKGQAPIHHRPGELLEPADLEGERKRAAERVGHPVTDEGLASWLLYPSVYADLERHRAEFSDTSVLPSKHFFYGLEVGRETSFDIEKGKTLILKLVMVGPLAKDGTREVFFELNGEGRSVIVRDQSAAKDDAARAKADKANPKHLGAPMPGKVLKVNVKPGDEVDAGAVLLVTEAMKMETNVKAKTAGKVLEVRFAENGKVEKDDLLVVFA
ncbi:MAG: biotin/lipoyl-containing protein, partial [Anaeromyxobacteraceae bacterium]